VNLEISTFERLRFYVEYSIAIYFCKSGELFRAAMSGGTGDSQSTAGYLFSGPGVIDFLDFKIGVRYQL
jgi:hypothetical protein